MNFPLYPEAPLPRPDDSLAPARSALAGLRFRPDFFRCFPRNSSPPISWRRETDSCGLFGRFTKCLRFLHSDETSNAPIISGVRLARTLAPPALGFMKIAFSMPRVSFPSPCPLPSGGGETWARFGTFVCFETLSSDFAFEKISGQPSPDGCPREPHLL